MVAPTTVRRRLWRFALKYILMRASGAPERGASEDEILDRVGWRTVSGRNSERGILRRNFPFNGIWWGRRYATKQVEAYTVEKPDHWLVITVITKYY